LGVLEQILEQRPALFLGPAFETHGIGRIDEQNPAAALGMAGRDGVHGLTRGEFPEDLRLLLSADLAVGRQSRIGARLSVHGVEPIESLLQSVRQRVIGRIHAGKHGIAAVFGQLVRQQDGAERRDRIE
jgi:hypothetical protein